MESRQNVSTVPLKEWKKDYLELISIERVRRSFVVKYFTENRERLLREYAQSRYGVDLTDCPLRDRIALKLIDSMLEEQRKLEEKELYKAFKEGRVVVVK